MDRRGKSKNHAKSSQKNSYSDNIDQTLPEEILHHILEMLNPRSLATMMRVNKHWHRLCHDGSLWQRLCTERGIAFGDDGSAQNCKAVLKASTESPFKLAVAHITKSKRSSFMSLFRTPRITRCLLTGPRGSGKTTTLYKLKLGEVVITTPTQAFIAENIEYKKRHFILLDTLPDAPQQRIIFQELDAIIFMVASNDREGTKNETRAMLDSLLNDPILQPRFRSSPGVPLLVFGNKQDIPTAMSIAEVTDVLGLHALRSIPWYIQATCATTGDGLYEGIDWLHNCIERK